MLFRSEGMPSGPRCSSPSGAATLAAFVRIAAGAAGEDGDAAAATAAAAAAADAAAAASAGVPSKLPLLRLLLSSSRLELLTLPPPPLAAPAPSAEEAASEGKAPEPPIPPAAAADAASAPNRADDAVDRRSNDRVSEIELGLLERGAISAESLAGVLFGAADLVEALADSVLRVTGRWCWQRLKQRQLASYLGITDVALSRIRRRLREQAGLSL